MNFHNMWHLIKLILILFLGSYLLLLIIMFLFQDNFIYFPVNEPAITPSDIGLEYEHVELTTSDGLKLSGWYIPCSNGLYTILFCHGNAGNISHRMEYVNFFYNLGYSTFIFDYRGYGSSQGKPSEDGLYTDGETALAYLTVQRNIPLNKIILFGRSLGSCIAARLGADNQVKHLILESAFSSIRDLAKDHYPFFPSGFLLRSLYPTADYLEKVSSPVLIMHSSDDEIIDFSHARVLFEKVKRNAELVKLKGTHNQVLTESFSLYFQALSKITNKK
ncbi:alpha/beta hydrolase [Elusimicrobiota bacterium]